MTTACGTMELLSDPEMLLRTCSSAVAAMASTQPEQPAVASKFDQCEPLAAMLGDTDTMLNLLSRVFYHGLRSEASVLLFGMALLRRVAASHTLSKEIVIVSLLTANKLNFDQVAGNRYWAKMTGVPVKLLNSLELEFFSLLDYKLHVCPEEYQAMVELIGNYCASMSTYQRAITDTIARCELQIEQTMAQFEATLQHTIEKLSPHSQAQAGLGQELLEDSSFNLLKEGPMSPELLRRGRGWMLEKLDVCAEEEATLEETEEVKKDDVKEGSVMLEGRETIVSGEVEQLLKDG